MSPFAYLRHALLAACLLVPCAAAAQSEAPKHFLWEVRSMTNRIHLFGTIHAGKQEWFPLAPAIEQAFADSHVLAVEADVTNVAAMAKTTDSMTYAPPDELSKHVPPADYARFREILDKHRIPEDAVKRLKPFPAASLLMFSEWGRQGYQPSFGIDSYLLRKAKAAKMPVVEIEGIEAQAQLMDSLTEEEQRAAFAGTITALESGLTGEQIEGMVKAWQSGDAFLMLEVARRYNEKIPGAAALEDKFIWSRHDAMVVKIEAWLTKSDKRHFVAVGSLHLAGPRGLVELLRKKGYLVRQR